MRRAIYISLALCLCAAPALAQKVYKNTSPSGVTSFSDQPSPDSEEIILPEIQTYSSQPYQNALDDNYAIQDDEIKKIHYEIAIIQPENGVTIGKDVETLQVKVYTNPELADKHLIQLHLNDKAYGSPQKSKEFSVPDLSRGTYQIKAVIIHGKKQDKIIKESSTLEFYVQRAKIPANSPFKSIKPSP